MPYRRFSKKNKGAKKKRVYRRKRSFIPRSVVPPQRLVKMRVCDRVALTSTSGAISRQFLNWNSLQDPFSGLGTAQALYYDQIKTMYRTAVVVGAKVTVQFHNTSSTVPVVVGLYLNPYDNSTLPDSYEYFRELSWTGRQRILSSDIDIITLSQKISANKYFHTRVIRNSDDFECDIENDGDPTKIGGVCVMLQSLDQATTGTCDAVITIEQVVYLKDPYTPARSVDA